MDKEKVVFFLEYAAINRAARDKGYRLDYDDLLHYIGEERFLVDAYCYVPIDPRNEHRRDGEIEELWRSGYMVATKRGTIVGKTYLCNFAVEITMDICRVVHQIKPDILVLASSNSAFAPLIQEVRKSGIRVEVAAFEEAIPIDMHLTCSGFIDLAVYYESYLATQNNEQQEDSVKEQYQSLIQAQEQDMVEQIRLPDLPEDDRESHAEQLVNEAELPVPESELY